MKRHYWLLYLKSLDGSTEVVSYFNSQDEYITGSDIKDITANADECHRNKFLLVTTSYLGRMTKEQFEGEG